MRFRSERQRRAVFAMMGAAAIGAPVSGLLARGAIRRKAFPHAIHAMSKKRSAQSLVRKAQVLKPKELTAPMKKGFRPETSLKALKESTEALKAKAMERAQVLFGEARTSLDIVKKLKRRSTGAVKGGIFAGTVSGGAGVGIHVQERRSRR